jgi:single-stranded-DNA-specific exonuclease
MAQADIQLVRRDDADITALPEHIPHLIRLIYARRGVTCEHELDRRTQALVSPMRLKGMDQALDTLLAAMEQRIVIVGDFDCDGATSTALLMLGLPMLGFQFVDFIVPNRFEYGYGLTPEIVDLAAVKGAELIITVDNGISSMSGVAHANALGIPVVVTDHHLPGEALPDAAAIVNPNLPGCDFPSKNLAGVGVAFYLLMAIRGRMRDIGRFEELGLAQPNLANLLDLVALGTVADVVMLDANNRVLVHQGLARIRAGVCRPGIQALIDVAGRQQATLAASDLGFALGPRLNAVGRLDDMTLGIHCLLTDDINQARMLASQMDSLNQERKAIEQSMQQEAEVAVASLSVNEHSLPLALALFQDDWHQGVVGLVASRIKEKIHRPVFAFAQADDGEVKGSGRSIPGVHLRDLLERIDTQCPGIILKFGGHAMAAGLSIARSNLAEFERQLARFAPEFVKPELLTHQILSDGELSTSELGLPFAEMLRDAGPWGQGFSEPLFDGEFYLMSQRVVGQKHLKMSVRPLSGGLEIDAIAFNVDRDLWPDPNVRRVQLAYKLDVNEFRGRRTAQLLVELLRPVG